MTNQEIFALMDRFDASSAVTLKLSAKDFSLELEKGAPADRNRGDTVCGAPAASPSPAPQPETPCITAPLVGTFYAAPSPEAPPFVAVGDAVKQGQTVCLMEAMKMMNEVTAPAAGVVRKILFENGQLAAFDQALGERRGIRRYGSCILPMDEALILTAVDISGRGVLGYALEIPAQKVGDFDTELTEEFMGAFARSLGAAVHLRQLAGTNSHHIIEGAFKSLARSLGEAVAIDGRNADRIPSTKGTIL